MMRAVFLAACLGIASAELALQIANDGSYAIDGYSIALKSGPTMFGVRPVFRSRLVCARERGTHARAVIGSPGLFWIEFRGGRKAISLPATCVH